MDYETLKEFICLTKYLNFSKAAFALHMTQPTLSRHIADLEAQLGTRLFVRNKSFPTITLTASGELFLEDAQRIVENYDLALYRIRTLNEGYKGEIVIGYRRIYNNPVWNDLVYQFSKNYPDINANYQAEIDLDQIYNKLLSGRYDIAFAVGMKEFENSVFQRFELQRSSLFAVLNVHHPLAAKKTVTFEDLSKCSLIFPSSENHLGFTDIIIDIFRQHNQSPVYFTQSKSMEDSEFYVATQSAVNIVPEFYFSQTDDNLCAREIEGTKNTIRTYGIYKKDNINPSLKTYVQFIKQEILKKPSIEQ